MTEQHEKYANELEKALAQFSENVNKIVTEMFSFEGKKEKDWKMKSPYDFEEKYFYIDEEGVVNESQWDELYIDVNRFSQGSIFATEQEAELEVKRRNLLTRFRAFRDECNGDWQINWNKNEAKYYLYKSNMTDDILCNDIYFYETFILFGYFKNEEDAERAIELFGDEIKELFVDCEAQ